MAYVYILECIGGELYTGITSDIERRLREHKEGGALAAKYTKSHRPRAVAALWSAEDMKSAAKLEYRIKRLTRDKKLELVKNPALAKSMFPPLCGISFKPEPPTNFDFSDE